jgi:hypothetical protein
MKQEISDKGGGPGFPVIVIDDTIVITGFKKGKIAEALDIENT